MATFEGWLDTDDPLFSHYFIEGAIGGCGDLQSLCRQVEIPAIAAGSAQTKSYCSYCARRFSYLDTGLRKKLLQEGARCAALRAERGLDVNP